MSFQLRPYQETAVTNVISDLQDHQKVGIIMPTGSGKTEVFIRIAERWLGANPEKAVLILSHLSLLTQQTFQRFKDRAPDLPAGVFQAGNFPDFRTKVIIGTMQTSRSANRVDDLNLMTKFPVGLVIIDEAHFLMSESYDKALGYFPDAKQVGCTATPFRSGALMTTYFDKISFSMALKDLIDMGFLVPPRLIEVPRPDSFTEEGDLDERIAQTAQIYIEKEKGKKAIIFLPSIESAKTMRNILDNSGVKAHAITAELVGEYRDDLLRQFKAGAIDVLTTVNVLTAGFDSPNVEAIFMPYPTQSPTVYLQRIGRGLRSCPEIGKTECRIYVSGDAPSISKGAYQKLQDVALEEGKKAEKRPATFVEEFAYMEQDPSSEVYLWTEKVVQTIDRMKQIGALGIAEKLNQKQFPKRFLLDIATLMKGLPTRLPNLPGGHYEMTAAQKETLTKAGFTDDCLKGVSKNEASAMIAAVINQKDAWRQVPHILPNGKFAGQHVKNINFYYRNWVLKNNPNGEIAQIIKGWEAAGGRYEKR